MEPEIWPDIARSFQMAAAAADQDAKSLLPANEMSRLQGGVFALCTSAAGSSNAPTWFYEHYRELLTTHCQRIIADQVGSMTGNPLLDQFQRSWTRYGRLVKRFNVIFSYLDQFYTAKTHSMGSTPPTLAELTQGCFRTHVLEPRKALLLAAVQGISQLELGTAEPDRASVLRLLEGRYGQTFGDYLTESLYPSPKPEDEPRP
ncbi:hypothetical protein PAPYR_2820 [Paratrimastix pyriformis]|uniref:Cullin N-terminal domain-containing protein n=1 Tax=Paratrimastix pyriformis TaxID=342808 RepID=A0ABQ8UTB6_9EUKA|nr:hypothetical protein PAPYR_2820 [Paratrimastix pyriformis]